MPSSAKNRCATCAFAVRVASMAMLLAAMLAVPSVLSAPGDLILPRKEGGLGVDAMPSAVFPHWVHRIRYRCDACHNRMFEMKLGSTEITMAQMAEGKLCGTCHNGNRAFRIEFQSCNRCHLIPDN